MNSPEPLTGFSPGKNAGFTLTLAVLRDKVNMMEMEQTSSLLRARERYDTAVEAQRLGLHSYMGNLG